MPLLPVRFEKNADDGEKDRMEFYPDEVSAELIEWAEREGIVEV